MAVQKNLLNGCTTVMNAFFCIMEISILYRAILKKINQCWNCIFLSRLTIILSGVLSQMIIIIPLQNLKMPRYLTVKHFGKLKKILSGWIADYSDLK